MPLRWIAMKISENLHTIRGGIPLYCPRISDVFDAARAIPSHCGTGVGRCVRGVPGLARIAVKSCEILNTIREGIYLSFV